MLASSVSGAVADERLATVREQLDLARSDQDQCSFLDRLRECPKRPAVEHLGSRDQVSLEAASFLPP
jgi:hypothetical protein